MWFHLFLLFSLCEYCLVDLLLKKSPLMFSQHFIECIFHFNSYDKHKKYNKFPQTERYILKLCIILTWMSLVFAVVNFPSVYGKKLVCWMLWVLKMCLFVCFLSVRKASFLWKDHRIKANDSGSTSSYWKTLLMNNDSISQPKSARTSLVRAVCDWLLAVVFAVCLYSL